MANEIMDKIKATLENNPKKADLQALAKECGVEFTTKTTVAQLTELLQALLGDEFTSKDHGKSHGISYYIDGVRMFVIKTRRNGQAVVMFTKNSGVTDYDVCRDTRYVCECVGAYNEALDEAKEAVRTAIANKAKKAEEPEDEAKADEPEAEEAKAEGLEIVEAKDKA